MRAKAIFCRAFGDDGIMGSEHTVSFYICFPLIYGSDSREKRARRNQLYQHESFIDWGRARPSKATSGSCKKRTLGSFGCFLEHQPFFSFFSSFFFLVFVLMKGANL